MTDRTKCSSCDDGEVYVGSPVPDDEGWAACEVCGGTGLFPTLEEIAELRRDYLCVNGDLQVALAELGQYIEHHRPRANRYAVIESEASDDLSG